MITVKTTLNNCYECRHASHSGAFTPGGAIPICRHERAPKQGKAEGVRDFNDVNTKEIAEKIFNPRRLNKDGSIPSWCPLRLGFEY